MKMKIKGFVNDFFIQFENIPSCSAKIFKMGIIVFFATVISGLIIYLLPESIIHPFTAKNITDTLIDTGLKSLLLSTVLAFVSDYIVRKN